MSTGSNQKSAWVEVRGRLGNGPKVLLSVLARLGDPLVGKVRLGGGEGRAGEGSSYLTQWPMQEGPENMTPRCLA
jgi:hypothetical protein